jgi:hypothetical protein
MEAAFNNSLAVVLEAVVELVVGERRLLGYWPQILTLAGVASGFAIEPLDLAVFHQLVLYSVWVAAPGHCQILAVRSRHSRCASLTRRPSRSGACGADTCRAYYFLGP